MTRYIILILVLSSCGTFTKMRYSSGFKSNFEFMKKDHKEEEPIIKAKKAIKIKRPARITRPSLEFIDTVNLNELATINLEIKQVNKPNKFENLKAKSHLLIEQIEQDSTKNKKQQKPPFEKNSKWAGILFLLSLLTGPLGIGGILLLISFILAIVGLRKIKRSEIPLRGKGIDRAIIILFPLITILGLIIFAYFVSSIFI